MLVRGRWKVETCEMSQLPTAGGENGKRAALGGIQPAQRGRRHRPWLWRRRREERQPKRERAGARLDPRAQTARRERCAELSFLAWCGECSRCVAIGDFTQFMGMWREIQVLGLAERFLLLQVSEAFIGSSEGTCR